jgi:hypothetical protein
VTPEIELLDSAAMSFTFDEINSAQTQAGKQTHYTVRLTAASPAPTGSLSVNFGLDETLSQPGPWSLTWSPTSNKP